MQWKHLWADTLGKRLFVLMWVALVGSHLVALYVARDGVGHWVRGLTHTAPSGAPPAMGATPGEHPPGLPPLPSLPPTDLGDGPSPGPGGPPPGPPPGASVGGAGPTLWLDYITRALVIALFAAFGARWLARPMRRLSAASRALGDSLARGAAPEPIDEQQGTVEVRQTAVVFNDMARRLHRQFDARGLVMASLSHDLRTPMTRLRMRLELSRGEPVNDAVTERCIADLREMDTLIDSLLDALRDERSPEPRQPLDVHALVQALADDLAEQGHLIAVTGAGTSEAQVASAAPLALRRVLSNLLGNALRYAGQAQADVRADGTHIVVTIDDNGPGIPPDQLEAVFEPFVRIETSRNRRSGGTGLGLHIARELTQRHGGQLTLTNRAEGGLRASLRLPRD